MKIKKTLIITLFLLCILMIGAVNASSTNDTTKSSDMSEDTLASSDVSDDTLTTPEDNNGGETNPINTLNEIKTNNDDSNSESDYDPTPFKSENKAINDATKGSNLDKNENNKFTTTENPNNTTTPYNNIKIDISSKIITPILDKVNEVNYVCYVKDDKKNYLDGTITVTFYTAVFDYLTLKTQYIPTTYTWNFNEADKISGFWILNNNKIVLRKTISSSSETKGLNIISSTHNSNLYNNLFKGEDSKNTVLYMINNAKFSINQIPKTQDNGINLKNPFDNVTKIKVSYSKSGETKTISLVKSVKFTHDIIKSTSKSKTSSKKITLTLKKVNIKKSAKKLVLTATLKKGKKTLKNKKVTFKFNGKKYIRKTNKKGVAKLIIKRKVLKKLKVGKKIKYQVNYGKKTIKRTVKVKK